MRNDKCETGFWCDCCGKHYDDFCMWTPTSLPYVGVCKNCRRTMEEAGTWDFYTDKMYDEAMTAREKEK